MTDVEALRAPMVYCGCTDAVYEAGMHALSHEAAPE